MEQERINLESEFDIDKISFNNVSKNFENKFREKYSKSLKMMANNRDRLSNASGANSLGMLEKMASKIKDYSMEDNFEDCYHELLKEYEPFTET